MRTAIKSLLMLIALISPAVGANIYLSSVDGDNADDGSTWALAKANLANALTAAGAGGTVYMDNAHNETTAGAVALASPGTAASPAIVVCVDRTGNPEPPTTRATTGIVRCTGANNITPSGYCYIYGVTLAAGTAAGSDNASILFTSSSAGWWRLDACKLDLEGTNTNSGIYTSNGSASFLLELNNTVCEFGHALQRIILRGPLIWTNTASAIAGTAPSSLIQPTSSSLPCSVICRGVDFSAITATLVAQDNTAQANVHLDTCKLGAGVVVLAGSSSQSGIQVVATNCDSADTNYNYHKQNYQGTITEETTIVRSGGATDGTTPISRKMVTTANSKIYSPLVSDPILVWVDNLVSTTVTVDVITDNVTLTDAQAWVDVEYLGTSGFPLSVTASDRISDPIFGTPANQTTDADSTWTTTGLGTPVEQELSTTFTPAEKGLYRVYVNLAKASTTMYFCPEVSMGSRQFMVGQGGYINEGGGGGAIFGGALVR
jgi:hypothetical protein